MRLVKEHPELYEELGHDAFFDLWADVAHRQSREEREAAHGHDQHPGRWGDHVSPARMRREIEREREEDDQRR